jgi:hypothetical protein
VTIGLVMIAESSTEKSIHARNECPLLESYGMLLRERRS